MLKLYTQMAMSSISRAKWRSFLTMLGVIIGITSVVMIFALGEGLKRQVAGELKELGTDLVVVRSGKIVERDANGSVVKVNLSDVFTQSILNETDVEALKQIDGVYAVAPSAYISASITSDSGTVLGGDRAIIATTPQIRDVLNRDVETGEFFTTPELNKNLAVLGPNVAKDLFGEDPAVGRIIKIKNVEYIVRGVMTASKPSPLDLINTDYDNAVYIPYGSGKSLSGGTIGIREIGIKLGEPERASELVAQINATLLTTRGGSQDFSVLESQDFVDVIDQVFGVLTTFVGAVAAISLFVGGIGIMNIMLVSVTERTREIGIRKAIGATNQQILGQFLVEAMILTMIGGILGVVASLIITGVLRVNTDLQPFVQWRVVLVALGVTVGVGVVFGIAPALKAARKDPIESLR
jgi:ABC-type antimicrobial peptide transport system permease subunit